MELWETYEQSRNLNSNGNLYFGDTLLSNCVFERTSRRSSGQKKKVKLNHKTFKLIIS